MRKISHEKKTHLGKSCVTMTDFMDKFYGTTELRGVICDNCTKSSITTRKSNFEKKKGKKRKKKKISTEITNATENIYSKIPF